MKPIVWNSLKGQAIKSWRQCRDEGLDVDSFRTRCEDADAANEISENELTALYNEMLKSPKRKDFTYFEPNNFEEILRECTIVTEDKKTTPDADRIRGAWAGRIAGCMLGKPLEGYPYAYRKVVFEAAGNWPIKNYLLKSKTPPEIFNKIEEYEQCPFADTFEIMPGDDDTNYTVLSLLLFEKYGEHFTPDDVLELWLTQLPYFSVCTAERVAYRNAIEGFAAPKSALRKNPYREYIGAQIRADFFGYVYPGEPQRAVNAAYRDASVSHTKNGIYGSLFVAAALSIAAVESDPERVVRNALNYVPQNSRLRKKANDILAMYERGLGFETLLAHLKKNITETDEFDWVHVLPNAMIVICALLCGKGDFEKSLTLAVSAGLDTDCNGATVGSILGMMNGFSAIDSRWYAPFHQTLRTNLSDIPLISIDELTQRTMNIIKKIQR